MMQITSSTLCDNPPISQDEIFRFLKKKFSDKTWKNTRYVIIPLFLKFNLPEFEIMMVVMMKPLKQMDVILGVAHCTHLCDLTPIDMVLHPFRPCNALDFYAQCIDAHGTNM